MEDYPTILAISEDNRCLRKYIDYWSNLNYRKRLLIIFLSNIALPWCMESLGRRPQNTKIARLLQIPHFQDYTTVFIKAIFCIWYREMEKYVCINAVQKQCIIITYGKHIQGVNVIEHFFKTDVAL
jgi:hypothetical protein